MPWYEYRLMRSTKPHLPEEEYGRFVSEVKLSHAEACDRFVVEGTKGAAQLNPNGDNRGSPYIESSEILSEDEAGEQRKIKQENFEAALSSSFEDEGLREFFRDNRYRNIFYSNINERLESGEQPSEAQMRCVLEDFNEK